MTNQQFNRGNVEKLVRWDADFYKALSSEDCIVCLTEQQVYLVGQIITQLTWEKTRWIGDKSDMDFKAIAGNLEERLADRMTCQKLDDLLNQVENITNILNQLTGNETIFVPDETVIEDVYPESELSDIGYDSGTCTTDDKDALYGGISQLVRYMHQANVDFFEELNQLGNISDQINRLKETSGVLNAIPFLNAFDFATFYVEELLQEYEATVDEDLLQTTICDLFCIAVANGCTLNMYDVYDYFANKVEPSFSNVATTAIDLIQFAVTGTMSGDEYYYFATYFQLAMAGLKQLYLGVSSIDTYAAQFMAGFNSPDNDWTLFCDECPTFTHWLYEWDFSHGMGDFTFVPNGAGTWGTLVGSKIESVFSVDHERIWINLNLENPLQIDRMNAFWDKNCGNGSANALQFLAYSSPDGVTLNNTLVSVGFAGGTADNIKQCNATDDADNVYSASVRFRLACEMLAGGQAVTYLRLSKVQIIGSNTGDGKPVRARWVTTSPDCADFTYP